ncbi:hypothetical protein QTI17_17270 [Variovorax sp. J31P179]|uniref:hypothetical protein n=1 Tax=Variovorax sp. J31P179 TaxID=3053508 RepID=UPI00257492A0|nr:hypothetical protein [Variovorax sp. J31P179]MDM0082346.1 hypothetical protein [Variovorax sp. J31P179]
MTDQSSPSLGDFQAVLTAAAGIVGPFKEGEVLPGMNVPLTRAQADALNARS